MVIQIMGGGTRGETPADANAQAVVLPAVLPGGHTPEMRGPFQFPPFSGPLSLHQSYDSQIYENCRICLKKMQVFSRSRTKEQGYLWSDISKKA